MPAYSELYPVNNACRTAQLLDGLWRFRFDPEGVGEKEGWPAKGLPEAISMAVPASFCDLFTTREERDYCGDFWYETEFWLPKASEGTRQYIRFGSATHRCTVYCNGVKVAEHVGGFLPVVAEVTGVALAGQANRLVVKVNNQLDEVNIPCGATQVLPDGRKLARGYFDFYNYSGIHRSVWLVTTPAEAIQDYSVTYELQGADALVHYSVQADGEQPVSVALKDAQGVTVAVGIGREGTLTVKNAHLWQVRKAYLYTLEITLGDDADRYSDRIGIRTVAINGYRVLINGEPVYLKGFGRHEDADILGKGFNYAIAKRDYECMKWIGANCFRTSHYPYAEEWYRMAGEEGFLIIDEVPGVGMMRSFANFAAAGRGAGYSGFFNSPTVPELQKNHRAALDEVIARDKNHPSVIAWSVFNEAETTSEYAGEYFQPLFDFAKAADPQHRPVTGVLEKTSSPQHCKVWPMMDFICLNRYYGWYICGGPELGKAREQFIEEMDAWKQVAPNTPIIFTEFGTDTLDSLHKLPSVMWSQEYQNEYMEMNFGIFDRYDFIQGELTWNFADFQTAEGIMRVNGNKKGIFTRARQPKDVAYLMKARWEAKTGK